jgi:hypothetical protein
MQMNPAFTKNEQFGNSQDSVRIHPDRQKRGRSTKEKMDSPTPKKRDEYRMAYTPLLVMTMSSVF